MAKCRGTPDTEIMRRFIFDEEDRESREGTMPAKLLFALRMALESGMTCEEISSILVMSAGLRELGQEMGQKELMKRSSYILKTMHEDIINHRRLTP